MSILKQTRYGVESVGSLVRLTFGNITITVEPEVAFDLAQRCRQEASRSMQYAQAHPAEIQKLALQYRGRKLGAGLGVGRTRAKLTDANADAKEFQAARDGTAQFGKKGNA